MNRLEAFDPRDYIENQCVQLELEVSQTAESAVKHIHEIEADLLNQIKTYRQRCLDTLTQHSQAQASIINERTSTQNTLCREISEFSSKWNDYYKQLNSLASESELQAAINQAAAFKDRTRKLDQEARIRALLDEPMSFNTNMAFFSARGLLGKLVKTLEGNQPISIQIQEKTLKTLNGHSGAINQVIFLPDGRLASCSENGKIKVWDAERGKGLFEIRGHTGHVYALAVLPNGWLASGSADRTIKMWDLTKREITRTLRGHRDSIMSLKVLKNGNMVSYSADATIKIWDPFCTDNNLLRTISENKKIRRISPFNIFSNDLLIACSLVDEGDEEDNVGNEYDENIEQKDVEGSNEFVDEIDDDEDPEDEYDEDEFDDQDDDEYDEDQDDDGDDDDDEYDDEYDDDDDLDDEYEDDSDDENLDSNENDEKDDHEANDDEKYSMLRVWNPNDGKLVKTLSTRMLYINSVLVLSNDQVAIATAYGIIKIIDLEDESKTQTKTKAHCKEVNCLLQLSNDHLASAGRDKEFDSDGYSIKVWRLSDMCLLQHIKTDHSNKINSLSVCRDQALLASSSNDKTVKLWQMILSKDCNALIKTSASIKVQAE